MPLCSGPPSRTCRLKINYSTVSFCIVDVFQYPAYRLVRLPPSKIVVLRQNYWDNQAALSWIGPYLSCKKINKCIGKKEDTITYTSINTSSSNRNTPSVKPVTYNRSKTIPSRSINLRSRNDSWETSSFYSAKHIVFYVPYPGEIESEIFQW